MDLKIPIDEGLDDVLEPISKTAIRLPNGKLIDLFKNLQPSPPTMTLTPTGFDALETFSNVSDGDLLKMWFKSIDNQYKM